MKNDCKCYQIRNDNFNNYTDEEEQQKNENNFRLKIEMPCAVSEHTSLIQIYMTYNSMCLLALGFRFVNTNIYIRKKSVNTCIQNKYINVYKMYIKIKPQV